MRVLHLISSAGMYGAESVVANLAVETNQLGGEAILGIFDNTHLPKNDAAERFARRGIKTHSITCKGRADHQTVQAIRKLIRSSKIEILHSHGYKADIYGYFAARALELPKIATRHNNIGTQNTPILHLYEFLDLWLLRRFDAVAAVSGAIADELRDNGISPEKINVIHNGIDLSSFSSVAPALSREFGTDGRLVVGTAGRLIPQKGMEYFLKAVSQVLAECPKVMFVVVGEGPYRAELEWLTAELGIKDNVVFTGRRTDMPNIHASFDVFVLPSLEEGFPMTILEAFASGRPVIATDVGAVSKVVIPNQTGVLLKQKDPSAIAEAILTLVKSPDLRARLGREGHSLVREMYSSRAMSEQYVQLYEKLRKRKHKLRRQWLFLS